MVESGKDSTSNPDKSSVQGYGCAHAGLPKEHRFEGSMSDGQNLVGKVRACRSDGSVWAEKGLWSYTRVGMERVG